MTVRSGWLLNPGQTRQDTRLAALGTFTPTAATTTRPGVIPGGTGLNLTGTGMVGTVAIGRAVVQGTAAQGAYPITVTVGDAFTVANGHASLPRIDSVFVVAYDQLYDASGSTLASIVVVQGTPNASPVAPTSVPNSNAYLKIWDILVPAGASAGSPLNWGVALTDQRTYTVAVGGITPGGSSVAGAYQGQWRDGGGASGILERYNGSAWEPIVRLGSAGRVEMGDVALYRSAADALATDDAFKSTHTSMASAYTESTVSVTVVATSYNDSTTLVSTTVVVPPSGRVLVMGQNEMYTNTAAQTGYSALDVAGSVSGALRPAADASALKLVSFNTGDNNTVPGTVAFRVTSANIGETLTIKWRHRVTGGGAQIDYRNITAIPLIG
jgi:hypothetical protein